MSFVEMRGLTKRFDGTMVFDSIDLDIDQGEMCVLVGPSGCGKTTLLRSIAGLVQPDAGTLLLAGRNIIPLQPKDRGIGMVMQHYALFPNMTIEQNLAFGLARKRMEKAEIRRRVGAMIELMGLEKRAKARPQQLSGGQKQRVALARALVLEPHLLLLDEPMSALDAQIRKRLRDELKRLQRELGFTAVLVTHDQEEALVIGDRIAVMQAGKLAQIGSPHDIYGRPASEAVAAFIGDFNILPPATIERVFNHRPVSSWAIHPEALDIVDPANGSGIAPDAAFEATAVVSGVKLLGAVVRYSLQAASVPLKMDVLNRPSANLLPVGSAVRIRLSAEDIREI